MRLMRNGWVAHFCHELTTRVSLGLAILVAILLAGGCAASELQRSDGSGQQTKTAGVRAIGVADDASPEAKGREVLRVVVEIAKHGDLSDTGFASRLLRLPIRPGNELHFLEGPRFPQQLVKSFSYESADVGPIRHIVRFAFNAETVCLQLEDFLTAFNEGFGIGMNIIRAEPRPPPRVVTPREGWAEVPQPHDGQSRYLQQGMPNRLGVEGVFGSRNCANHLTVQQYRTD